MGLTRTIVGLGMAGTTLLGGVGAAVLHAGPAGASAELVLVAHGTNFQYSTKDGSFAPGPNDAPPSTPPVPGDRFYFRDDLSQNGRKVGFDNIICTVTFNDNTLCEAMVAIDGRGDIHATALVRSGASGHSPTVFDAVIDGGTFGFRGAKGDIHLENLANGDTQMTFNIV